MTRGIRAVGRRWVALAALSLLAGLLVAISGVGIGAERAGQAIRDDLRRHPMGDRFALVEIDARSLARVDHWPWPRDIHARLIEQLERAGASTVAFDVDFSAHGTPAGDRALATAIEHARVPIVLPTFRQYGSLTGGGTVENLPIAPLRAHAELAAVNIQADGDGLVRRYPYGVTTGGVPRPSIGALLAGAAGRANTAFAIDGAIDPATVPRISVVDLLAGRARPGALAGKTVLIGATAIELGDRYPVPRHGVLPGPVIQLLAAETLRDGSSPVDHGPAVPLGAAALIVAFASRRRGRAQSAALALGAVAIAVAPLALEVAHLGTVAIVPALFGLGAGAAALLALSVLGTLRTARLVDTATGLPNRRSFERDGRVDGSAAVTVVRIANYSDAAALLGQARAGELIGRVVDRLRVAGIADPYRLEDGVLGWAGTADEQESLDGLATLLRAPVEVGGRRLELRCHLGTATAQGVAADILADRAILAADHAIEQGSRWEAHSPELGAAQDWRLLLAGELDEALAREDLWVAYQPKLDIASGRVVGAEALVRWRHPERGAIPPDAFIPALEASGRVLDLTLFVLRQAWRDATAWRMAGAPLNVAVNVSALLATDTRFLDQIDAMIEADGHAPELLTLEVTESATLADPDRAVAALERIAARGIKISIDDYGTGQSTLTYLKRLPAREIKIDKSFVLGLEGSLSDQAMVRSTIELAHELGFSVVAEGVETASILAVLAQFGCDTGQGWHIGKPMPAAEFAARYVVHQLLAA